MELQLTNAIELKSKFEEDAVAPFRSRFTQSMTLRSQSERMLDSIASFAKHPQNLAQLPHDGGLCDAISLLVIVVTVVPHGRFCKGLKIGLTPDMCSSVVVVRSTNTLKTRTMHLELSFRTGNNDEGYSRDSFGPFRCHPKGGLVQFRFTFNDAGRAPR